MANDYIELKTPGRGIVCRLRVHGSATRKWFHLSVFDPAGKLLVFATGGPDDVAPRVDRNDDGSRSLWLASACVELRGDAEAKAAERFIARHAGQASKPHTCGDATEAVA